MTERPSGKLGPWSMWGIPVVLLPLWLVQCGTREHPPPPIIPLRPAPLPPQTPPIPPHLHENSQESGSCLCIELIPSANTRKPAKEPDILWEKLGHEERSQSCQAREMFQTKQSSPPPWARSAKLCNHRGHSWSNSQRNPRTTKSEA